MSNDDLPASNPKKPKPRSSHRQDLPKAVTVRELTRKMQPPPPEMNDDLANELVAASVRASGEQHTSRDEKRKHRDSTPTPEGYRGGKHKFARRGFPSVDGDDDPMDGTSRRSRHGYYEDDTPPRNGDENAITQPRQSASHTDGTNHHSSPPASPLPFIGPIFPTAESRDIMPLPRRKGKGKGGVMPPPPVPRTPPRGITYSAPEEFTPPGAPSGYSRYIPDAGEAGPSNWATRDIPAAPSPPQLPSPERETWRRSSVPSPFINATSPTPAVWVTSPSSLGSMPSPPLPSLTSVPSLLARLLPSAGWHNPIAPADIPTIPSPIAGRQRYLNGRNREYRLDESLPDPEEPVPKLAEKRKYRKGIEFDASLSPKRKRRKWNNYETEAQAEELREQLAIEADIRESSARDARMRELEDMEASRARNRAMRLRSQIETGVGADRDSEDEDEEDEFFLTVQDLDQSSSPSQSANSSYTDSFDGSPTHGVSFNVIGATPDTSLRITSPATSRGGLHPDDSKEIPSQGSSAELTRLARKEFAEALAQQGVQESSSQGQSFNFSFTHVVGQPITHGTGFYNGPPGIHRTYDTPPRRHLRVMVVGEGSRLANDEEVGSENGSNTDVDDDNVTEVDSDHENQTPSRRDSRRYFHPQSDNEANIDGEEPMDSIADSNVNSPVSSSDDEDMALSGGPLFGFSTMGGRLPSLRRLSSFFSLATPPDQRRSSVPPAPLSSSPQPQTRRSSVPPTRSIGHANVRRRAPQPSARPAEERTDEELAPVTAAPGSPELAAAQPSSAEEARDQTHSEEPEDREAEMARLEAELAQAQAEKAALEAEAAQVAEFSSAHNGAAGVQLDPYATGDIQPTIENETEYAEEASAHYGVADAQPSSAPSPTNPATIAVEFVPSTPEAASSAAPAASTPLPATQPAPPAPSPPPARRSARVRNPSARAAVAQEAMSVGRRTRTPAHSPHPEAGAEAEVKISKPTRTIRSTKQTEKGKGKAEAPEEGAQELSKDESEPRPVIRLRLSVELPSRKRKSTNSANTEEMNQETNEPEMRPKRARRAKAERTGSTAASTRPTRSSARIASGTTTTPTTVDTTVDTTAAPLPAPASALAAPAAPARRGGPRKATATLTVAPSSRTRRSAAPPPTPIEAQIPKVAAEVESVVKAEPEIPSILEADVEPEVELKSKGKPKAQPKKKAALKGKPKPKSASETGPKATTTPKKPVTTKASLKKKVEAKLKNPSQPKSDAEPRRSARLRK